MDLKEEKLLGGSVSEHWYYRAKSEALDRVIGPMPATVLDVGAGAGFFSRHLLDRGVGCSTCVDPGYDGDHDEVHAGKPLLFRRNAPKAEAELVLMMDVLEHVEDDVGLVAEYISAARPGTRFVITVPAFNWMWSSHDDFLEHKRRYTLSSLASVLCHAGLKLEGTRYLYGMLLPLAALTRLPERLSRRKAAARSQMHNSGALANKILLSVCRVEACLPSNRLAGLTAMAWGRTRTC